VAYSKNPEKKKEASKKAHADQADKFKQIFRKAYVTQSEKTSLIAHVRRSNFSS